MDTRLKQKQDLLKRQFAAMESALQSSQSQGQWLQGQLNSLKPQTANEPRASLKGRAVPGRLSG